MDVDILFATALMGSEEGNFIASRDRAFIERMTFNKQPILNLVNGDLLESAVMEVERLSKELDRYKAALDLTQKCGDEIKKMLIEYADRVGIPLPEGLR